MRYAYHEIERAAEKRRLIRSIIPRFILRWRKRVEYKRHFPKCFVDMDAAVDSGANIGAHCVIRKGCSIGQNVEIGAFTTVGPACTMNGTGRIQVGKFCSIAPECFFWSENHILDTASTFPFEHFKDGKTQSYKEYKAEDIQVGHDVWIGHRANILAGANIGNGCVIAAGSVVPRGNYEPYSVVAGVPGKIIKKRLPDDKITELLASRWWDKDEQEIFGDLMRFLHSPDKN